MMRQPNIMWYEVALHVELFPFIFVADTSAAASSPLLLLLRFHGVDWKSLPIGLP